MVSYSLANVINATRTITFVNNFGSVSVFVFVVKEGFDLPCLPQDYKNEIEISELVDFFNKCLFSSKNERKFSSSFLFAVKTKKLSKTFIEKLNKFTNFSFIFVILWQTRQIKTLFNNKDKNTHRSKVVYKGDCSCGVDYIGETVRNLAIRIAEHSNPAHTSEPAKHLRENPSHSFTWRVLSSAQTFHKRRIVEGLMIQQFCPILNKQVISYASKLFPSGIT